MKTKAPAKLKVAIDFDNTFFTPNRDIDDGLALLYLLGTGEVEIVSVTTTYGNKDLARVMADTSRLLEVLGLDAKLLAAGGEKTGDYLSPASQQLAKLAEVYAGELCVLATGSMTNLHGAYLINPNFFKQVKQFSLMGGITAPLQFKKQIMHELNFSCDPQAAYSVLSQAETLAILTGNHCLDLLFTEAEYAQRFTRQDSKIVDLIREYTAPWFKDNETEYGIKGFYNWDALAAAYLVHPEYFKAERTELALSVEGLATGHLHCPPQDHTAYRSQKPYCMREINLPIVADKTGLREHLYATWQQFA